MCQVIFVRIAQPLDVSTYSERARWDILQEFISEAGCIISFASD